MVYDTWVPISQAGLSQICKTAKMDFFREGQRKLNFFVACRLKPHIIETTHITVINSYVKIS